jgi:hypothetical protein
MWKRNLAPVLAGLLCLALGACLYDEADDPPSLIDYSGPAETFSIGGTVEGAAGLLTLQNSNGTLLSVARNGAFTFETRMVQSALYNVTVAVPPHAQTCTVRDGSGTVSGASVRNVTITCK